LALSSRFESTNSNAYTSPKPTKSSYPQANPRSRANLGSITTSLIQLLERYGASQLDAAILEALERDVPHPNAVRLALERQRDERRLAPPVALTLPAHVRARDKTVQPHSLEIYDQLKKVGHEKP
jgi:hypothetical protein